MQGRLIVPASTFERQQTDSVEWHAARHPVTGKTHLAGIIGLKRATQFVAMRQRRSLETGTAPMKERSYGAHHGTSDHQLKRGG